MNEFWNNLTSALEITGISDKTVWQDTIISSILIGALLLPLSLFVLRKIGSFFNKNMPLHLLFGGMLSNNLTTLIFLSQLTALDDNGNIDSAPSYTIKYPFPLPTNRGNIATADRGNIDPVWSEGDGECLADVFNALGTAGIASNIKVADTIQDWFKNNNPIISIGFNPKTLELEKRCYPLHYRKTDKIARVGGQVIHTPHLSLGKKSLHSIASDAGIIQKTFIKNSDTPVFILAGLGTLGTSAAGYILRENAVSLGKLYGNDSFCILISVVAHSGRSGSNIVNVFPKPKLQRRFMYPITYIKFNKYFS